jgi:NAD(P)-dependent dehydrogenase (short-subunit alcohol dehydrogenase family)
MLDVKDKVAFVTGAASGIGRGIARAFAGAGMKVMLADIEKPVLDAAAAELAKTGASVSSVVCDVSDKSSVMAAADKTLSTFGKVHVVCNNAGVSTGGLIEDCSQSDWDWIIGVNYYGVVYGCQAFVPHIKRQGEGGHIVNTASLAGVLGGMAGWTPYNSTKFAVVGLTEALRQEGKDAGFGASVLCPGGVATNIFRAPRNRQAKYGPQQSTVAFGMGDGAEIEKALDPRIAGELVLEGIQANRLYIFTDPRYRKQVARRFEKMLEDFDWAANSDALVRNNAPGAASSS